MSRVNIDIISSWRKYVDGLCKDCHGSCCTMPVEISLTDLIRLGFASEDDRHSSIRKLANRLKKDGIISSYRQGTDLFMLTQKANGDCVFLNTDTRLCTKYEVRPEVCRKFPSIGPRPDWCPYIPKNKIGKA